MLGPGSCSLVLGPGLLWLGLFTLTVHYGVPGWHNLALLLCSPVGKLVACRSSIACLWRYSSFRRHSSLWRYFNLRRYSSLRRYCSLLNLSRRRALRRAIRCLRLWAQCQQVSHGRHLLILITTEWIWNTRSRTALCYVFDNWQGVWLGRKASCITGA